MLALISALVIGLIAEQVGRLVVPAVAAGVGRRLDLESRVYWVAWLAGELHCLEGLELELEGLEGLQAWVRVRVRRPQL